MLKVKKLNRFNGLFNEVTLDKIRRNVHIDANYVIELYEDDKIIHLNIPHGNIHTKCTADEWAEIIKNLKEIGLNF